VQLIGMLDSPFVRRVAISLRLLGLPFQHRNLSVFRGFDDVRAINPVAKVPTLICDDGFVLVESGLILDHLETLAGRSLWPAAAAERRRALRIAGLALAACEKSGQIVYERWRPADRQLEPWLARLRTQAAGAYAALEEEFASQPLPAEEARLTHAAVASAVAWRFAQLLVPDVATPQAHPALAEFTARAELQPAFVATPPDENHVASYRCD
jgi:glutathione S-transferase